MKRPTETLLLAGGWLRYAYYKYTKMVRQAQYG